MSLFGRKKESVPLLLGASRPTHSPEARNLFAKIIGYAGLLRDDLATEEIRVDLNHCITVVRGVYCNDELLERLDLFMANLQQFLDSGTDAARKNLDDSESRFLEGCQIALGTRP